MVARSVQLIFTADDVPRPKPAPDLFLHAAAALGVSIGSVRTWIELAAIPWSNLNKRGPYNIKK